MWTAFSQEKALVTIRPFSVIAQYSISLRIVSSSSRRTTCPPTATSPCPRPPPPGTSSLSTRCSADSWGCGVILTVIVLTYLLMPQKFRKFKHQRLLCWQNIENSFWLFYCRAVFHKSGFIFTISFLGNWDITVLKKSAIFWILEL